VPFLLGLPTSATIALLPRPLPSTELAALRAQPPARIELEPIPCPAEDERWHDITGTAYASEFRTAFRYADARVTLTYTRTGRSFRGWLEARGLKPNFAYQMKLRGDTRRDPEVHRILGYLGRWRLTGRRGTNFTDYDYETAPDKSQVESYILFDFFVTDAQGRARKTFYLNSTLHVLWNSAVNYVWENRDMLSQAVLVERHAPVYAPEHLTRAPETVELWAESQHGWQPSRPPVGQVLLPEGRYVCDFVLTEESFHRSATPGGGYWATVLGASVDFVIDH